MWRYRGYLQKSAYEEGEGEEPMVLLDSAAARLVKINENLINNSNPKAGDTHKKILGFIWILLIKTQFFITELGTKNPLPIAVNPSCQDNDFTLD